jgi:hypothetical protein
VFAWSDPLPAVMRLVRQGPRVMRPKSGRLPVHVPVPPAARRPDAASLDTGGVEP